jgi:hypothetical protein
MHSISSGKDNWYTVNIEFNKKPVPTKFSVEFNHTTRPKDIPFQQAADEAILDIASKFTNLHLGLSGGLDSEFIAEVLYRNKIPFTPIIGASPLNNDYRFALHWCKQHNITPITFDYVKERDLLLGHCFSFLKKFPSNADAGALTSYLQQITLNNNGHLLVAEPTLPLRTVDFYEPITDFFTVIVEQFLLNLMQAPLTSVLFWTPELVLSAARELDVTLDDPSARAKLYNIPYRPKVSSDFQRVFDLDTVGKINNITRFTDYSEAEEIGWTKSELIDKLTLTKSGL